MSPATFSTSPHSLALREDMTRAGRTMWFALRNRPRGFKFRRQVAIRIYIVDCLRSEANLVLEIDGGQHTTQADAYRTAIIESCGFQVVRFWNNEVSQNLDGVLSALLRHSRRVPSPNPLPQGEDS